MRASSWASSRINSRPSANSSNGSLYASRVRDGDQARNSMSGLGSVTLIGRRARARA
jgi:hypothetical protein